MTDNKKETKLAAVLNEMDKSKEEPPKANDKFFGKFDFT